MDFILSALNYLLGIPVLGWGTEVGFVYKAWLLLVALLIFTAYVLSPIARSGRPCKSGGAPTWWGRSGCSRALPTC